AITISANSWTDAGHAVNQIYDILYMMNRDDIPVGVGGDGGILDDGTILPNVGGYLPIIEQGMSTAGDCRYRQAIPVGAGGRLDTDSNYGVRRSFLPRNCNICNLGSMPMPEIGAVAVSDIYFWDTSKYLQGQRASRSSHLVLVRKLDRNKVFHSGIPITLVPLDATNAIPINEQFFMAFEQQQDTYEAQYCFQSIKSIHDTQSDNQFYTNFYMWDSFTAGVAVSIMRNADNFNGENEFAEMEYLNLTVVTSNKPYGIYDGSNPLFDGRAIPKFSLQKDGVHSGHVQTGLQDPFCFVPGSNKGKCKDGYTKEVTGSEGVHVLVAKKAKPNQDVQSPLDREAVNLPQQSGRFNISRQFPYYRETLYMPDFTNRSLGKPVVFDMDMSAGDFLALTYLLKVPVEIIDLKGISVSGNGWANAATIDVIYDVLHMMGRDDIPVDLGNVTALGTPSLHCKYVKAIPQGSGGLLDSDTLYGLARTLPRSPRRYTANKSVKFGAPRNTDHPELRQPLAMEVWQSITRALNTNDKIMVLTNGPLTNLANIILSDKNGSSVIQNVYVVGGHILDECDEKGNIFTVPSNKYAEFNMFLDPVAAKKVIESDLPITLIPLKCSAESDFF
ncbi:putative Pyrimidine-specific ribonucleoside hydrolase RihA, partial [Cocos nucifera]|nr:putative Pyrimidine-specific ribonucleoside hydrolase RihA [Cocos nucifera]